MGRGVARAAPPPVVATKKTLKKEGKKMTKYQVKIIKPKLCKTEKEQKDFDKTIEHLEDKNIKSHREIEVQEIDTEDLQAAAELYDNIRISKKSKIKKNGV